MTNVVGQKASRRLADRAPILGLAYTLALGCAVDDRRLSIDDAGAETSNPANQPCGGEICVDDFEDNLNASSKDPRLGPWQPYFFGPGVTSFTAGLTQPGFDSNFAFALFWQITDTLDQRPSSTHVGVSSAAASTLDLSGYSRFSLAHRYANAGGCPPVSRFTLALGCSTQGAVLETHVPVSKDYWKGETLPLVDFTTAQNAPDQTGQPPTMPVMPTDCLKAIDEVRLQVDFAILDGGCASGNLFVDSLIVH